MKTIQEKVEQIQNEGREQLLAIIESNTALSRIIGESKEIEHETNLLKLKLLEEPTKATLGWPYFDDVCYLTEDEQENFDELFLSDALGGYDLGSYPKERIFQVINEIKYLQLEIKHTKKNQANKNRGNNRLNKPQHEGLLKIINFLHFDDPSMDSLLQLLKNMGNEYQNKLNDIDKKHLYMTKEVRPIPQRMLTKTYLSEFRAKLRLKKTELKVIVKQYQDKDYQDVTNAILFVL